MKVLIEYASAVIGVLAIPGLLFFVYILWQFIVAWLRRRPEEGSFPYSFIYGQGIKDAQRFIQQNDQCETYESFARSKKLFIRGRKDSFLNTVYLNRFSEYSPDCYAAAWHFTWNEQGRKDAVSGRYRGDVYREHAYNMGWWNEMIEMRKHGWQHHRLDNVFERMKQDYWGKVEDKNKFYESVQTR